VLGIKCSTLHVDGKPVLVTMDYKMDIRPTSLSLEHAKMPIQERLVYAVHYTVIRNWPTALIISPNKHNFCAVTV